MRSNVYSICAALSLFVVLVTMKCLYEDFGILRTTGKKARTLHIMEVFPNERGVVLIHKIVIELSAACFVFFVIVFMFFGSWQALAGIGATALATVVMYLSYRNTLNFFLKLEKEIIQYLKDKQEGDSIDEENT